MVTGSSSFPFCPKSLLQKWGVRVLGKISFEKGMDSASLRSALSLCLSEERERDVKKRE
jgi:hypothetical protein